MPEQAQNRQRIVVGVDGSPASESALRWAVAEAERRAACLEAVIAWRPSAALGPPAGHPPASERSVHERREDAEHVLDDALRQVEHSGVEVTRRVMHGSAHRVLLQAADGAEMIVLGGRRSGKLSGKLPWSTGQQVVGEAPCPVVVVPAAAGARDQAGAGEAEHGARTAAPVAGGGVMPA